MRGPLDGRPQGAEFGRRVKLIVDPGHQRAERGVGAEGHFTGDRFDEHQRQRIEIGLAGERLAFGLLGRGVAHRAQHHPGRFGPRRFGQRFRQPEIGEAQAAVVVEEQVGRLHITVDDAALVRVLEPAGGLESRPATPATR